MWKGRRCGIDVGRTGIDVSLMSSCYLGISWMLSVLGLPLQCRYMAKYGINIKKAELYCKVLKPQVAINFDRAQEPSDLKKRSESI
jgi:hypothetical protein